MTAHRPGQAGPWIALVLLFACLTPAAQADEEHRPTQILEVGPAQRLKKPSEAAKTAPDGALVMIHAGFYLDDVAVWRQNRLRIVGVGGMARLLSTGKVAEDKAIWVFTGDDVEVEHIGFSGARSIDHNGAGIRFEGSNLTLRHCRFHDNEMGLLTSPNPAGTVRIEHCDFHRNTTDYQHHGKLGHNIYVGQNARLVLRESHVYGAHIGHQVKSRARENILLYNRIGDENGRGSYLVDLPDGGRALIMGNLLHKSAGAENQAAISFAAETNQGAPKQELYVVYNSFLNQHPNGILVQNHGKAHTLVANNLAQGEVRMLQGVGRELSNLAITDAGLRDAARHDFHLDAGSLAIDAGHRHITTLGGKILLPKREYRHPRGSTERLISGPPDVGAYEFTGNMEQ